MILVLLNFKFPHIQWWKGIIPTESCQIETASNHESSDNHLIEKITIQRRTVTIVVESKFNRHHAINVILIDYLHTT